MKANMCEVASFKSKTTPRIIVVILLLVEQKNIARNVTIFYKENGLV